MQATAKFVKLQSIHKNLIRNSETYCLAEHTHPFIYPIIHMLMDLRYETGDSSFFTCRASPSVGRAIAKAVSRRLLNTEARFRAQGSPYGICGGQSGTRTELSPNPSVFSCHIIPPLLKIHSSMIWGLGNGPVSSSIETWSPTFAKISPTVKSIYILTFEFYDLFKTGFVPAKGWRNKATKQPKPSYILTDGYNCTLPSKCIISDSHLN
jgi:hypothetical protein